MHHHVPFTAAFAAILLASAAAAVPPRWSQDDLSALVATATAAPLEGLPNDYGATSLLAMSPGADTDTTADTLALTLARDFLEGSARTRTAPSWHIGRGTLDYRAWLDDVLARHSVRSSFRALLPTGTSYLALKEAFTRCDRIGRECTTIAANLDRWRALPRDLGSRYLLVNVPAYRLDLIENDHVVASHRVIVGKPGTQTPSFRADVIGVTINPWWNVPCSIVDESIGKLIRTNPAEAARRGYVATRDAKGKLVVRQKPGPENALGRIKLEMPNPYGVYIHDTPSRDLFGRDARAFSHGCIRTEDPKSLALTLLGTERATTVDLLLATGASKTLKLAAPVPVYVVYMTAEADPQGGDGVVTYNDIYKRDAR